MTNDVERVLSQIAAILRIAHADKISELRATVRSHPVDAAILDTAIDWTPAGKLSTTVAKNTGQSERNVRNRVSDLIALGALEKQGASKATAYRATGLL
jgi:hypothetical protein